MARLDVTETFHSIMFPGHMHTKDSLNYATNFQFQDTDTVIVTYPKSGNNEMHFLCSSLVLLLKGNFYLGYVFKLKWQANFFPSKILLMPFKNSFHFP